MAELYKLTQIKILKSAAPCKLSDGGGLWLVKRGGSAGWFFRYDYKTRRHEIGIGGASSVTLKRAREIAAEYRAMKAEGINPIEMIRQPPEPAAEQVAHTVEQMCIEAFDAIKHSLKGMGEAGRWYSPLRLHVIPKIGQIDVEALTQHDVVRCLEPIWQTKSDTARKCCNRLGIALQHAAAHDLNVDLQAIAKARALLGRVQTKTVHIESVKYEDVPALYKRICEDDFMSSWALRFIMLTSLRSTPARRARFEYIDDDGISLTTPGELMKGLAGRTVDYTIPLCAETRAIIDHCQSISQNGYLFCVNRTPISDATIPKYLNSLGVAGRPHGFRTSMRTWLAEKTDCRFEVGEMMISHVVGSKVERTYKRTDYLDERRIYQQKWSDYVTSLV